jgi:hypothetical protein
MFEAGAMARSVTRARVCPILFDITKEQFNLSGGPLSFFQAVEFTEDGLRKLQKTINNGKLGEVDLIERFDVWWDKLKERIEAITASPQPALKEPSDKELLGEILGLTRAILREFQGLPPWQRFSMSPQVEAVYRGLMGGRTPLGGVLDLNEPATSDAVPVSKSNPIDPRGGGLTPKSE